MRDKAKDKEKFRLCTDIFLAKRCRVSKLYRSYVGNKMAKLLIQHGMPYAASDQKLCNKLHVYAI